MDAHTSIAIGYSLGIALSSLRYESKSEAIMAIFSIWMVYGLVWLATR